jgi:hypothetical protein
LVFLDEIIQGLEIIASSAAAIGLVFIGISFRRAKQTEETQFTESIFKDIRSFEDEEEKIPAQDKKEWARKFFNTIEWLSFLINNNRIKDGKLIEFFRPGVLVWYEEWFCDEVYVDKSSWEDDGEYTEFKKLYRKFKNK